ncbi:MAG: RIP metalloprotease RseP [Gammaproteobacteria bacterium]|nr:RIP metalloprotease RseP [Gammaproteobacteria bacterium]
MEHLILLISYLEYVFWFILVFTIIVFIHEYGHYFVAKLNGVDVEKFSIGFGPVLFKKIDKNNTIWQICSFPLGGFVKFSGEMYSNNKKKDNNVKLFMNKKPLQKASIVIAGPAANFLLSLVLFIFIFFFFGKNHIEPIVGSTDEGSPAAIHGILIKDKIVSINKLKIDNYQDYHAIMEDALLSEVSLEVLRNNNVIKMKIIPKHINIKTFIGSEKKINYLGINPLISPVVGKVIKNSPANIAGLLDSDRIVKINGKNISDARQIIKIVKGSKNISLKFTIKRNNMLKVISITPLDLSGNNLGQIGIAFKKMRMKLSLFESINLSIRSISEVTTKTLVAFSEILFGKRDHCEVGGPILIAKVSNDVANTDMISFIALIALISVNLGLINLFPLPLLDGGHFFTYISEFIIGKNINYNLFKAIQLVGVIIIFSFMAFSIINDIYCRVLN